MAHLLEEVTFMLGSAMNSVIPERRALAISVLPPSHIRLDDRGLPKTFSHGLVYRWTYMPHHAHYSRSADVQARADFHDCCPTIDPE